MVQCSRQGVHRLQLDCLCLSCVIGLVADVGCATSKLHVVLCACCSHTAQPTVLQFGTDRAAT